MDEQEHEETERIRGEFEEISPLWVWEGAVAARGKSRAAPNFLSSSRLTSSTPSNTMLSSLPAFCTSRYASRFLLPSLRRQYASAAKAPSPRPLLGRFDHIPIDLARVQSGTNVRLRDYEQQKALKRFSFDLKLKDGLVHPAEGENFIGPNGCSLRPPLSPTFQEVVRNFRGSNIIVYVLPEGTRTPFAIRYTTHLYRSLYRPFRHPSPSFPHPSPRAFG